MLNATTNRKPSTIHTIHGIHPMHNSIRIRNAKRNV